MIKNKEHFQFYATLKEELKLAMVPYFFKNE
jgi:hypothetical protein